MLQITTLSQIPNATTDGNPGLWPNTAACYGRRFVNNLIERELIEEDDDRPAHALLGQQILACKVVGVEWKHFSTFDQLKTAAKRIHEIAEHNVVTNLEAPLTWLCQNLSIDLDALEAGISKAAELGSDWKEWTEHHSASYVLQELIPHLQPITVETKTIEVEVKSVVLKGKARKEQKRLEAAARQAKADAEREALVPGTIVRKDGVAHFVCTGKRGECKALSTEETAFVGSFTAVQQCLGIRWVEISDLPKANLCKCCADQILSGTRMSLAKAATLIEQAAQRKLERETKLRAKAPSMGRALAQRILRNALLKPDQYVSLGMAYDRLKRAGVIAEGGRTLQKFDRLSDLWRHLGSNRR